MNEKSDIDLLIKVIKKMLKERKGGCFLGFLGFM